MSEHEEHTLTSQGFYIAIGVGLLIGTATTVGAAFVNLGPFNPVVALLIATIKAIVVVLFFMHVKRRKRKAGRSRSPFRLLLSRDSDIPVPGGLPDSILAVMRQVRGERSDCRGDSHAICVARKRGR